MKNRLQSVSQDLSFLFLSPADDRGQTVPSAAAGGQEAGAAGSGMPLLKEVIIKGLTTDNDDYA